MDYTVNLLLSGMDATIIRQELHHYLSDRKGGGSLGERSENTRKFALLGDPALHFAHPKHNVITATINNISIDDAIDTLKALSEVTITGEMQDNDGNKLIEWHGDIAGSDNPKTFKIKKDMNIMKKKLV